MRGVFNWIGKHPWLFVGLVVFVACLAFGPTRVGGWIGTHGRSAVLGVWHFAIAFLRGIA